MERYGYAVLNFRGDIVATFRGPYANSAANNHMEVLDVSSYSDYPHQVVTLFHDGDKDE